MFEHKEFLENAVDRRSFVRKSVLWEAAIRDGAREDGGVLLNVSEGGALLRVSDPFACPTTLDIEIARVGKFPAEVAWRGVDAVGVVFKEAPQEVARRLEGPSAASSAA